MNLVYTSMVDPRGNVYFCVFNYEESDEAVVAGKTSPELIKLWSALCTKQQETLCN